MYASQLDMLCFASPAESRALLPYAPDNVSGVDADDAPNWQSYVGAAIELEPWLAAASRADCCLPSLRLAGQQLCEPWVQAALREWVGSCTYLKTAAGKGRARLANVRKDQASQRLTMLLAANCILYHKHAVKASCSEQVARGLMLDLEQQREQAEQRAAATRAAEQQAELAAAELLHAERADQQAREAARAKKQRQKQRKKQPAVQEPALQESAAQQQQQQPSTLQLPEQPPAEQEPASRPQQPAVEQPVPASPAAEALADSFAAQASLQPAEPAAEAAGFQPVSKRRGRGKRSAAAAAAAAGPSAQGVCCVARQVWQRTLKC